MQTKILNNRQILNVFPDENTEIVRFDFTFEAGTALQPYYLVAGAANQLFTEGTLRRNAEEISEFMDFRGISMEKNVDVSVASLTVYTLRRYAVELLPLLREMLTEPAFSEKEFRIFCDKRRQTLRTNLKKTAYVARNAFYEALYGREHPLGGYAVAEDVDKLKLEDVREFFARHYCLNEAQLIISGGVDEDLLEAYDKTFGREGRGGLERCDSRPLRNPNRPPAIIFSQIESPQSTIRIGRVIPDAWDSMDYARFLVLNTVLGGYFGSRLMTNIREDKGYTYGIYSQTQIYRENIVFFIVADVAANHTQDAVREIYVELERLAEEPISDEELDRVRSYMRGDYLRSIDGVFEQTERFRQFSATGMTEQFTKNLLKAIEEVTPEELQSIARSRFQDLTEIVAGPQKE